MKKTIIFFVSLICSTHCFAYNIYNQTGFTIHVNDVGSWRGMNVTIPNGGVASCAPASRGCNGFKNLEVNHIALRVVCGKWEGKLGKDSGNFFIVTASSSRNCEVRHYHD